MELELIPVEKYLPEPGETLLLRIMWLSGDYDWVSGYFGEEDLFYQNNTDEVLDNVTHWASLPSAK